MIVLDTSVLAYATGDDHALRDPCLRLLEAVSRQRVRATTTVEVLQEFAHIRARRSGRTVAAALARDYMQLLSPLLLVGSTELLLGLQLFEDHPRLGSFDAVLAAAAIASGAEGLASSDRAFAAVRGVRHLDPADNFSGFLKL